MSDRKGSNTEELSGKTILIIGTSGQGLQFLWKILQDLNIKVCIMGKYFCIEKYIMKKRDER